MQGRRKLRVLEVTTSYPRFVGDSPGLFNFRLDRELVKAGVDIQVLAPAAPGHPGKETIEGIKIRRVTYFWPRRFQTVAYGTGMRVNLLSSPLRILQLPFLFLSLLINILVYGRNVDVIHCHWAPVGFVGLMAKPLVGKPVILTLGGTDYRDLPVFFWRYVVEHVDAVISVATETERYLERIGYHKYNVIRTLVDEREFNPAIDAKGLKEEFRVKDEKIVCFVGGIYPIKGPQTLVEAAPYVRERKADVRFFIVGGGVYLEDLKGRAIELGANGYVTFTGPRTDIAKFLKVSTIFTALSPVENTWSNSIAEAMFMGTPLILTDAGYTREFFTHMKDCILVPPNDPKSLAEAIYRLLEDPILQKNLAEGAYDLLDRSGKRREDIVAKTLELYGSVSGMD